MADWVRWKLEDRRLKRLEESFLRQRVRPLFVYPLIFASAVAVQVLNVL